MMNTGHCDPSDEIANLALEFRIANMAGPLLLGGVKAHIDRYRQFMWMQLLFLDKNGLAPYADI